MQSLDEFKDELRRHRRILVTEENLAASRELPRDSAISLWRLGPPIGPDHPQASSFGLDYRFLVECAATELSMIGDVINLKPFAQLE